MTTEEKFRAAVNVIRGLPEKGSFQPSTDLKLKFYAYFKQATEGPNLTPKPYMWEVVNKFKWDAWKGLGNMSKEDAMLEYLRALNSIVESMATSGNVEEFLVGMEDFYAQVPAEDVDLCIGPTIEKIRSKSSSSLPSHPGSVKTTASSSHSKISEDEDEYFLDSIDTIVVGEESIINWSGSNKTVYANGNSGLRDSPPENTADILTKSVYAIRNELDEISESIKKLEKSQKSILKGRNRLFGNLSPQTIAFFTLWPVFVNLGLIWLYSRRRKQY